jgi:hypothetical protein
MFYSLSDKVIWLQNTARSDPIKSKTNAKKLFSIITISCKYPGLLIKKIGIAVSGRTTIIIATLCPI